MTRSGVALGFSALLLAAPSAQDADTRIVIHVAVENVHGEPLTGLAATAFSITVDGQPRPVIAATPASGPLSVIVLTDRSRSMRPHLDDLDDALEAFASALAPEDRVRAASLAGEISFATAFTTDKKALRSRDRHPAIPHPRRVAGGSPLWDAIHQSVELLAREPGRRAVVVFSDGRSTGNWHGLAETAEFAMAHGVSISAVLPDARSDLPQTANVLLIVRPTVNLDKLATYTGGLTLSAGGGPSASPPQFRAVANRLLAGYTLTFASPSRDGRAHELDVAVHAAVQVRAPRAFRAPER